jgi:hypothetical protein
MASILKVDTIQDQSGNNIINENADTITIGASGDTVNIVGTLQNNGSGFAQGITEADQWRVTSNLSNNGDNTITANWERNDTDFALIGTGLTESSGIFSFPSTGIYNITFMTNIYCNSTVAYAGLYLYVTTDNSNYNIRGWNIGGSGSAGDYTSAVGNVIIDVTNIANTKFKLNAASPASIDFQGSTSDQRFGFTVIRLGDT